LFKEYTQNHQRKENTFLKQKTLYRKKKALYQNKENPELKESTKVTEITENNKQGTKASEQSIFKKTSIFKSI
jgi:hypothetical protein